MDILQLSLLRRVDKGIIDTQTQGVLWYTGCVHAEASGVDKLWAQLVDAVAANQAHVHLELVLEQL